MLVAASLLGVDMNEHVVDKAVKVVESTTVKDSNRISWSDETTENKAHESFQSNNSMPWQVLVPLMMMTRMILLSVLMMTIR